MARESYKQRLMRSTSVGSSTPQGTFGGRGGYTVTQMTTQRGPAHRKDGIKNVRDVLSNGADVGKIHRRQAGAIIKRVTVKHDRVECKQ
jgi:hypothetical protein